MNDPPPSAAQAYEGSSEPPDWRRACAILFSRSLRVPFRILLFNRLVNCGIYETT
jgi:hypothetical protein